MVDNMAQDNTTRKWLPKPTWRRSIIIIGLSALIIVVSFLLWANSTNALMPEALLALEGNEAVAVTQGDYIQFVPNNEMASVGFVLYPGGRVLAGAYAPLALAIAEQGYFVAIVHAPLNLAFFDTDAASAVIEANPQIETWVVGGHSLGGVAASIYAANHEDIAGLVLMASFPADGSLVTREDLQVLSLYGTLDGVASTENILQSTENLPLTTQFVAIEGGNHGQFGYYGMQEGDNIATISHAEQLQQITESVLTLLRPIAESIAAM